MARLILAMSLSDALSADILALVAAAGGGGGECVLLCVVVVMLLVFISCSRNYKNASRNDRFQQIESYVFLHRSLY